MIYYKGPHKFQNQVKKIKINSCRKCLFNYNINYIIETTNNHILTQQQNFYPMKLIFKKKLNFEV